MFILRVDETWRAADAAVAADAVAAAAAAAAAKRVGSSSSRLLTVTRKGCSGGTRPERPKWPDTESHDPDVYTRQ